MTVEDRDYYRLNILKVLCEKTDYNITKSIQQTQNIIKHFGINTDDDYEALIGAVQYLTRKGFLESKMIPFHGGYQLFSINLTALGVDIIERIERKASTDDYENDFSRSAIMSLSNIQNSNIVINSSNVSISLADTISCINSIPNNKLSENDKSVITERLKELSSDKSWNKWEKTKAIIKWIADKGFEVTTAVLPFILNSLKQS